MMMLPQFILEIIFLVWIVNAMIRTLSYLKMKRQDYKLTVMKKFSVTFSIGVTIYVLIRISKVLYEMINTDSDAWKTEHRF